MDQHRGELMHSVLHPLRALGIPPERSDVPTLLVVGLFTLPPFFTSCPSSK